MQLSFLKLYTILYVLECTCEGQRLRARLGLGKPGSVPASRFQFRRSVHKYDLSKVYNVTPANYIPMSDYLHYPRQVLYAKKFKLRPYYQSGDFNVNYTPPMVGEEYFDDYLTRWNKDSTVYDEEERYHRLQGRTTFQWFNKAKDKDVETMSCYCAMVYKRFRVFAMGAILTYRAVLTSAFATHVILRRYSRRKTMMNILGIWYSADTHKCAKCVNASHYATPARINYHPQWFDSRFVNRSYPFPIHIDLAVWITTYRMYYESPNKNLAQNVVVCNRWHAKSGQTPKTPYPGKYENEYVKMSVVSAHMVMDQDRKPMPWFIYAYTTRSSNLLKPCPKVEWGWFFCLQMTGPVARLGVEPGAALHIHSDTTKHAGLAGLATINLFLRSKKLVTYFTVLDRHVVLDWLYDVHLSRVGYEWIDYRFMNVYGKPLQYRPLAQNVYILHKEPANLLEDDGKPKYQPIFW